MPAWEVTVDLPNGDREGQVWRSASPKRRSRGSGVEIGIPKRRSRGSGVEIGISRTEIGISKTEIGISKTEIAISKTELECAGVFLKGGHQNGKKGAVPNPGLSTRIRARRNPGRAGRYQP